MTQYVDYLCQEIRATPKETQPLQTIFFGGGTPSLLSVAQVKTILAALEGHFGITEDIEISMEMDPGTFTFIQLQGFCEAGVNRISLGVQAFQDDLLQQCGRTHTVAEIYDSIEMLTKVGQANFSLDLISGLPGQTMAQWQISLERAIAAQPTHISTYDLVLEPTTVFGKRYQPGQQPLPTDETAAQMYRLASEQLSAAGYRHYEISNYARDGFECCHNSVYWRNQAYYGFGMGATSYVDFRRFSRPRTRAAYFDWVRSLITGSGQLDAPVDTQQDRLLETLMLGLRLAEGLQVKMLKEAFGSDVVMDLMACLQSYPDWCVADPVQGRIRLTDPEGFLFSNQVLVALWEALSVKEPSSAYTGE